MRGGGGLANVITDKCFQDTLACIAVAIWVMGVTHVAVCRCID